MLEMYVYTYIKAIQYVDTQQKYTVIYIMQSI